MAAPVARGNKASSSTCPGCPLGGDHVLRPSERDHDPSRGRRDRACLDGDGAPRAICTADGKPLLSWRVALLPYLEEGNLYREFPLDEPWDSEHNLKLLEQMPAVYADPSAPAEQAARGLTTVQVMSGEGTAFVAPADAMGFDGISDGTSKTIAIVEALPENAVPWTKPDDIEFNPDLPLAGVGNPRRTGGLFAAGFFDGSIRMITPDVAPELFGALVTPAGGEQVGLD